MLFFLKQGANECFIGVFQFYYYLKFKKYLPSIIIKELFYFTKNGFNLKSIKNNFPKSLGKCQFYWATKTEIPNKVWSIIAEIKNDLCHFILIKKIGNNSFLAFDSALGYIKNYQLSEKLIYVEITFNNPLIHNHKFDFSYHKDFIIVNLINVIVATFLFVFLSFYFRFLLISVENNSYRQFWITVVVFSIVHIISIFWNFWHKSYSSKYIWFRIKKFYKNFLDDLTSKNEKLKLYFSNAQIHQSMNFGIEFLTYTLEVHKQLFSHTIMIFSTTIIIFVIFKNMLYIVFLFLILNIIFTIIFKKMYSLFQQKRNFNEVEFNNVFLYGWNFLSSIQSFLKNDYKTLLGGKINKNISINQKINFLNNKIEFIFDFLNFFFLTITQSLLLFYVLKSRISLANAFFLITITNILYSNAIGIITIWLNHNNQLKKYYNFIDVFSLFKNQNKFSYEGVVFYNNILQNRKGFIQITGPNGSGKTTALKIRCNIFRNPDINCVYLDKNFKTINNIDQKILLKYPFVNFPVKGCYSSGEQQIINLISVLEKQFETLIIDESLLSVEYKIRNQIYNFLKNNYLNKNIFIVDHQIKLPHKTIDVIIKK